MSEPEFEPVDEPKRSLRLVFPTTTVERPSRLSRSKIAKHLQNVFEMIGGELRMAHWANEEPGEFYKLYCKMLPGPAMELMSKSEAGVQTLIIASAEDLEL